MRPARSLSCAIAFLVSAGASAAASGPAGREVLAGYGRMPLYFIENRGQTHESVSYYVQGAETSIYFGRGGVTLALHGRDGRWGISLDFLGANPDARPAPLTPARAVVSYFRGPAEVSHTGLPTYAGVVYRDLWPGIDLEYSGDVQRLKYQFIVRPGVDPHRIRLAYRGAKIALTDEGTLSVATPAGGFQDGRPVAWQELAGKREAVDVGYEIGDDQVWGFRLGGYDPAATLVIDPLVLVYSGFIGGAKGDYVGDVAVDAAGHAYVAGHTNSVQPGFPVKAGPDLTYNGALDHDAFVAKVDPGGTQLLYLGYIGSPAEDVGLGVAVDPAGNAYVTGYTESGAGFFPAVVGPFLQPAGSRDAFVAKVSPDGTRLLYSGFLGGKNYDYGRDIDIDSAGSAYICGETYSSDFPVRVGPDLSFNGGGADAFVAKITADGSGLVWSGFIGGAGADLGRGVAVDAAGSAYVAGNTQSPPATFPVKAGPSLAPKGQTDAFVAKVAQDGASLVYAGYIGGTDQDGGADIAVDRQGYAYVIGSTSSTQASFPVVIGPDTSYNGAGDAYVAKVAANGSGLVYCGYIGGSSGEYGEGIAVDAAGNAYVVGTTLSGAPGFPVLGGPDLSYNGGGDAFIGKVRADGSGFEFLGYHGGSEPEYGQDVAVDASGGIYFTGITMSPESVFPVKAGPDLTHNQYTDVFVAKLSQGPSIAKVTNAASYVPPGLPNSGIARGALFVAMGEGIGPAAIAIAPAIPWPSELGDTTIDVTVGGVTRRCFLYYTSAAQSSGVMPSDLPEGLGEMVITHKGEKTPGFPVRVVRNAFGIFTRNQAGFGPAIMQNWYSPVDLRLNGLAQSSNPGGVGIIWGSGLGPITGASDGGVPPVGNLDADVEVIVGDKTVKPFYYGRNGMGVPSIDQIQFFIPPGISGCRVPLAVMVNTVLSNFGTIAIAEKGLVCGAETDLQQAQIESLVRAGGGAFGTVVINPVKLDLAGPKGTLSTSVEDAWGGFARRTLLEIETGLGIRSGLSTPYGTCIVYSMPVGSEIRMAPADVSSRTWLDAGASLNLKGPRGQLALPRQAPGRYSPTAPFGGGVPPAPVLPPFLTSGQYTVDGQGGADLGPFAGNLTMPEPPGWTNRGAINQIDRTRPLTVNWTGVDPAIQFISIGGYSANLETRTACTFICTAPALAGTFTVPPHILQALPATSPWSGDGMPAALLAVGSQPLLEKAALQVPGLDFGYFLYLNWTGKNVEYK